MKIGFVIRLFACIIAIGYFQYIYLQKQHKLTKIRLEIPKIASEYKKTQEENLSLKFEIDRFENPYHLLELAKSKQFSHLKHPLLSEIITISMAKHVVPSKPEEYQATATKHSRPSHLFVGAK